MCSRRKTVHTSQLRDWVKKVAYDPQYALFLEDWTDDDKYCSIYLHAPNSQEEQTPGLC
jgi:hypothetical protein